MPMFTILIIAIILIVLSIPLMKRKVKRSLWFGYRVSVYQFQDEEIWYATNAIGGKHLVWLGVWVGLCGIASLFVPQNYLPILIAMMATVLVVGLLCSLIYVIRLARRMARERGLLK